MQDAPALRVLGQEVDVGGLGEGLVFGQVDSYLRWKNDVQFMYDVLINSSCDLKSNNIDLLVDYICATRFTFTLCNQHVCPSFFAFLLTSSKKGRYVLVP